MRKIYQVFGTIATIVLSCMCFVPHETTYAQSKYKIHLGITPIQQKIELEPGERKASTMKVQNLGTEEFSYSLSASPYQVKNQFYEPDLITENSYTQIAKWVTFEKPNGRLKPGETVEVKFNINVPSDVPAGGQYASINASTSDGSDGSIRSSKSVGMKLIARVAGVTRESGEISNNHIDTFFAKPPIKTSSMVKSTSNVDITAKYSLVIRNFFTGQIAYSSDNDESVDSERVVLPDTQYLKEISWEGSPRIGIFKVKQVVTLLDKTSDNEKIVILCPIWLVFLVFTIIFIIVISIIRSIKSNKTKYQSTRY